MNNKETHPYSIQANAENSNSVSNDNHCENNTVSNTDKFVVSDDIDDTDDIDEIYDTDYDFGDDMYIDKFVVSSDEVKRAPGKKKPVLGSLKRIDRNVDIKQIDQPTRPHHEGAQLAINEERFYNPNFCMAQEMRITGLGKEIAGMINGHEYVDLGLPSGIKWAIFNLNATSNLCNYRCMFYGEFDYPATVTEYVNRLKALDSLRQEGIIDENNNLAPDYDVVRRSYGAPWRMPTKEDFEELIKFTSRSFIILDCIPSHICTNVMCKFTGKNGKSIYFPLTGVGITNPYASDYIPGRNIRAFYMSATSDNTGYKCAVLHLEENPQIVEIINVNKWDGGVIRPVAD